jgi:hypothetical protein
MRERSIGESSWRAAKPLARYEIDREWRRKAPPGSHAPSCRGLHHAINNTYVRSLADANGYSISLGMVKRSTFHSCPSLMSTSVKAISPFGPGTVPSKVAERGEVKFGSSRELA